MTLEYHYLDVDYEKDDFLHNIAKDGLDLSFSGGFRNRFNKEIINRTSSAKPKGEEMRETENLNLDIILTVFVIVLTLSPGLTLAGCGRLL